MTWTDADRATWRHAVTLTDMVDTYTGRDCVVVAGGPSARPECVRDPRSLNRFYRSRWTISCNRAADFSFADFAACFEPRKDRDVWEAVMASGPTWVLSHIDRDFGSTILTGSKKDVRPWIYTDTKFTDLRGDMGIGQSTFYAIACAIALGFHTIGVIGLDMTKDRYPDVAYSEAGYRAAVWLSEQRGRKLINLNHQSRLKAIPPGSFSDVRAKKPGDSWGDVREKYRRQLDSLT